MPLTRRTNGSGASNLVTASWWNDFVDLLTGVLTDQLVTIANNLHLKRTAATPASATYTLTAGGNLGVGAYRYFYTWVSSDGREKASSTTLVTTTSGSKSVSVTGITIGPSGTVSRKIYRSKVNGRDEYLLATLNNNTATTFTDNIADSSLSTTGGIRADLKDGSIVLKDENGNITTALSSDGVLYSGGGVANGVLFLVMNDGAGNIQTIGEFNHGGLWMYNGGVNANQTLQTDADLSVGTNMAIGYSNAANSVTVVDAHYAFGLKLDGNKAFEINHGGNAIIAGSTYANNASGFDGYDFAECFDCEEEYPAGTVVCPGSDGKMHKCSHDSCPVSYIISKTPGFLAGSPEGDFLPVAIVGKVKVKTAHDILVRSLVCSDGRGGVRAVVKDEWAYSMGVTISPTEDGEVGILIRNMLVKGV